MTNNRINSFLRLFRIKSLSVYQLTLILLVLSSTISVAFIASVWVISETQKVKNEISELRETAIEKQKEKLKAEVSRLINYLEYLRQDTVQHSVKQIQGGALAYFEGIRFGNDGYVFVNTYDGIALLFDGQKLETPRDISDLTDPNGLKIFQKEMELAKLPEGGYFQYLFKKIYDTKPLPKISYIVGFGQWGWIIGAGDYLDNIDNEIAQMEKELKSDLDRAILTVFGIFILVLLLLLLLSTFVAKSIQNQFNKFVRIIKNTKLSKVNERPFERIFIRELKTIGYDIVQAENQSHLSEQRFSDLFQNAPISIWEEDYTELMTYLNIQLKQRNLPIEELFEKHPEVLIHCSGLAKVLDVNNYTVTLYKAKSKEELIGNLEKVFTSESFQAFAQSLVALHHGKEYFSAESKNIDLKGNELDLLLRWSFLPHDTSSTKKVIVTVVDLTELRKTEQELIASEARFRSIFENDHTVMFVINPENGKFIDANPAAVNYYGYSHKEFREKLSISDINPQSQEEIIEKLQQVKSKKKSKLMHTHRLSNGEIRDVEIYSGLIHYGNQPAFFAIVHDITEKLQAQKDILAAKNKTESIFNAAPIGIGVVSNRVFTEVNDRFLEMIGYSNEELLGRESVVIYPSKEESERVGKEKYEQIRKNGTGTVETKFKRKDGKILEVLLSSTPLDLNDISLGVTFTALDISDRKKDLQELEKHRLHLEELVKERTDALSVSQEGLLNLVDDLNQQSEKLATANARLAEINEELETFTYSVSHDLKAPLRGIDGYSQLLLEDLEKELTPEALQFLQNIRKSTAQMNLLIEDLLAYSRMERKDFQSQETEFGPIVDSILLQLSNTISENKVKINTSIPEKFSLFVDKDGLTMVLRNLLDNALKFSIRGDKPQIEIGCSEDNLKWLIFVKDNGIGFDMKYHDRIFKIFQRLHLTEEYEGTGIGLAMVSKAVQRMNGKIWAESGVEKGATFYLEIEK